MNCKVDQLDKNIRYKLLEVDGNFYIIDMDRNAWMFFFPFLNWVLPHHIFIIDEVTIREINIQKPTGEGTLTAFGAGGIAIIIGNLMKPVINYLEIETTTMVNIIIFLILLVPVIFIRFKIRGMNRKKMFNSEDLAELPTERILIKPKSIQYRIKYLLLYLFAWTISLATAHMFLIYGNIIILICSLGFILVSLILNNQAIRLGKAKIEFIQ